MASIKHVGELQALSMSGPGMEFACKGLSVAQVLAVLFHSQVVVLDFFCPPPFASTEEEKFHLLCPVRALMPYVDCSGQCCT